MSYNGSQNVAHIPRLLANINHQRPVLADEANSSAAGHVPGHENADHALQSFCVARIDTQDSGARMVAEFQCAMLHSFEADVIDILVLAQDKLLRPVFRVS
jgi:hypothetical protein